MEAWNLSGENRIPWPEGIAHIHAVAVYPVNLMRRHDPQATRPCAGCAKSVAQTRYEPKLDVMSRRIVKVTAEQQGQTIVLAGCALPEQSRLVAMRLFFQLIPGARWISLGHEDFELPGKRAAAEADLVEHNSFLRAEHEIVSGHETHAEVTRG